MPGGAIQKSAHGNKALVCWLMDLPQSYLTHLCLPLMHAVLNINITSLAFFDSSIRKLYPLFVRNGSFQRVIFCISTLGSLFFPCAGAVSAPWPSARELCACRESDDKTGERKYMSGTLWARHYQEDVTSIVSFELTLTNRWVNWGLQILNHLSQVTQPLIVSLSVWTQFSLNLGILCSSVLPFGDKEKSYYI